MNVLETLLRRNRKFAETRFDASLQIRPTPSTVIIGCAAARVDPAFVLGVEPGEALTLRNIGGRVTPRTIAELVLLREIARTNGSDLGPDWDIVVLQHTRCGITRLHDQTARLAGYFEVPEDELPGKSVSDPWAAVTADVALLRAEPRLAGVRVALAAGEHEVLTDETTTKVHAALALPVTALYPALAQQ